MWRAGAAHVGSISPFMLSRLHYLCEDLVCCAQLPCGSMRGVQGRTCQAWPCPRGAGREQRPRGVRGACPAGEMRGHPRVFGVHEASQGPGVGMAWTGPKEGGAAGAFWHFLSEQSRHRLPELVWGWSLCPPRTLPPRGLGSSRGCRARRLQSAPACPRPSRPRVPFSPSLALTWGVSFLRGSSSHVLSGVSLCWA